MSLDLALTEVLREVPECVAALVLDLNGGLLLSCQTTEPQEPGAVAQLLWDEVDEPTGAHGAWSLRRLLEKPGDWNGAPEYYREVVVLERDFTRVLHSCSSHHGVALLTVCKSTANVRRVVSCARRQLASVEDAV